MRGFLAFVAGVSCLVAVEAKAQCATSCSTVTPKHPVILVHGRNDDATRWDTLVSSWSARGYTEGVNLFRFDAARDCGANDETPGATFLGPVHYASVVSD